MNGICWIERYYSVDSWNEKPPVFSSGQKITRRMNSRWWKRGGRNDEWLTVKSVQESSFPRFNERMLPRSFFLHTGHWRHCYSRHTERNGTSRRRNACVPHARARTETNDPRDAHGALSRRERRDFSASNVRTCMRTCVVAVVVVVVESSLAHTGPPLRWPRTNNSHGVATSERERTLYIYVRCCVYVLKYVYTPLLRARKADWNIQRQLGRRVATLLFFSLSLSLFLSSRSWDRSEIRKQAGIHRFLF